MSESRYDVVFRGEILSGFELEAVKQAFAALFKISEAKVEQIFSGARVTLKGELPQSDAEKYQRRLQDVGANIELIEKKSVIEPADTPLTETTAHDQDAASMVNAPAAEPVVAETVAEEHPDVDDAVEADEVNQVDPVVESEVEPAADHNADAWGVLPEFWQTT